MTISRPFNDCSWRALAALALVLLVSMGAFAGDYVVKMKRKSGVYTLPCEVNGVKREFIFDTGAANTSLSQEFVNELMQKKRLLQTDFTGAMQTRNASGSIDNNTTINIRQLKVGNRLMYNVKAIIAVNQKAPLLLGLNAIDLLGEWTMKKNMLVLHDYNNPVVNEQQVAMARVDEIDFEDVEQETQSLEQAVDPQVTGNASHPSVRLLAYKGDARAQYLMGMFYLDGDGVDPNPNIAVHWLKLSAMQNYGPAKQQLVECYSLGVGGVEPNQRQADYWRQMEETESFENEDSDQVVSPSSP